MKLTETCRVAPANSAATTELTLPLTFLDLIWFKLPPVERLFFYSVPGLDPTRFNNLVLPKLKNSLALTLDHYLPLAGNLLWPPSSPKPFLRYRPGDAVSLSVSESAADFSFLSGNHVREAEESRQLAPIPFVSHARASVLALSITLFPSSGFCVGVSANHGTLDGKSTTLFMKSWAHICKEMVNGSVSFDLPPELSPVFDRTAMEENPRARGLDMAMAENLENPRSLMTVSDVSNDLVSGTFVLSPVDIEKLRNRVMKTEHSVSVSTRLSTFVLSISYVFVHTLKAKVLTSSKKSGNEEKNRAIIGFPADYRARLDPPMPQNYVGNCVGGRKIELEEREWMEADGFERLAVKMSEAVRELEKGVLLDTKHRIVSETKPISIPEYGFVGIAGSNRFGVYGVDFGWGRPEKVAIQSGVVSVAESREYGSGGVEIGVVLTKLQMQHFKGLFYDGLTSP